MRRMMRWWPLIAGLGLLAGCATPRPDPGVDCPLLRQADGGAPRPLLRSLPEPGRDASPQAAELRAQILRSHRERSVRKIAPPGVRAAPAPYDVLVLSAGGQFGAYGSGFLAGWNRRPDLLPSRAEIDMVSGVSTGAVMATYAYLGASADAATRARYDALLETQYTTLRNEDVFRKRSPIEYLWANSIYDSAPLRQRIAALITDELLDAVVEEAQRSGRLLYVGAVNADSGAFEVFDLVALARDRGPQRRACYAAAIQASAAIPVVFGPVFINGRMYLDGGARQNAFFVARVAEALPEVERRLFAILHGDLAVPAQTTSNHLIGVVSRTSSIASDQLVLDAAYYVDAEAKRLGFRTRWTSAVGTGCDAPGNDDMFSPALGRCLWDVGHARVRQQAEPWKEFSQIRNP